MHALRVLIIDDVYIMRELIRKILENEGHIVVGEAKDGEEGIRLYKELNPDLVTLDINMPILNGIEAIKRLRNENDTIPILTITGERNREVQEEMMNLGSYDIVRKPFQPSYLLKRISHLQPIEGLSILKIDETHDVSRGKEVVEPLPAEDDLLDFQNNDEEIEFDLCSESTSRPDPVFVVKNDQDSIEIVYEESERKEIEKADSLFLLTTPALELQPEKVFTPPLLPEMFTTHDENLGKEDEKLPIIAPAILPPRGNRGFTQMPERLKAIREQQFSEEDEELIIHNTKEGKETTKDKPSLWSTLASFFKK